MTEPTIASVFATQPRPDDPSYWTARVEYLDDEVWFGCEGRGGSKIEAFQDLFRRLADDTTIRALGR